MCSRCERGLICVHEFKSYFECLPARVALLALQGQELVRRGRPHALVMNCCAMHILACLRLWGLWWYYLALQLHAMHHALPYMPAMHRLQVRIFGRQ